MPSKHNLNPGLILPSNRVGIAVITKKYFIKACLMLTNQENQVDHVNYWKVSGLSP